MESAADQVSVVGIAGARFAQASAGD